MLKVRLLGQFELCLDQQRLEITAKPAQSLLAYLLLNRTVVLRRERLAGLLWPDSSEANARRNLRQTLWQIRRAVGPAHDSLLLIDDLTIAFNPQIEHQIDAAIIASHVDEQTSADTLIELVAGYGGELLPGFYDDWVLLERDRLQMQFDRKLNLLLEKLVAAGRWQETLQWGEQWIALGHTPEPAYRGLMRAHAALGNTSSVAESYRRCVEALERDLAVEPSAQTRALYEQLRNGQEQAAPAVASMPGVLTAAPSPTTREHRQHNLPVQLNSFVGRAEQRQQMLRLLGESHLLTLTGSGGAGKTRLALQVAQELADGPAPYFADGIWLVELAMITEADLLLQTVAVILGVREESNYSLLRTLIEHLRNKSLLLILDNCEHLIEACAHFVDQLLRACRQVKVLVTGRETLGIAGESILRVPSLTLPDRRKLPPLAELAQTEAIRLFVERAARVRVDFQLNDANAPAVAQICQQLDGLPLAIELAAARVRSLPPEQIAARLDDRFRLLTGGSRTALPRQQTLRALIDWSWDLLSELERTLLRRLAVFLDGWTLEAAEWVGAGNGIAASEVLDLLSRLVEKSLVLVEENAGQARYALLETIRQYARDKLLDAGEAETTRSKHLHCFLALAEQAEPALRGEQQLHWLARLQAEDDNLRAALKWAQSVGDSEAGLRLAGSLMRYWYLRGYWNEGREWLQSLLAHPATSPGLLAARAKALYGLGWLADDDGSEIPYYSESLALCRQVGDRWGEALSLRGLAAVNAPWANLEQAGTYLHEMLVVARQVGDGWLIGLAHFTLGWLAFDLDHSVEAEASWQAALTYFRQSGDRWGIGVTLGALGYVARLHGHYDRAAEWLEASLRCFKELGDKAGVASSLTRLGSLAWRRGDYREAMTLLQDGLTLRRQQGSLMDNVSELHLQSLVASGQGDYAQAHALLDESLQLAYQSENDEQIAKGLLYQAMLYYAQANLVRARQLLEQSLHIFHEHADRFNVAHNQHWLALALLRQDQSIPVVATLQASLAVFRSMGDRRYIALGLDGLGLATLAQGAGATALAHFGESLRLRRLMVDKHGIAESLERIATLLVGTAAEDERAAQLLAAAWALRQAIGAPVPPLEQVEHEQALASLRNRLGEGAFLVHWEQGSKLSYEQATTQALADFRF